MDVNIDMKPVSSSNISSAGYDPVSQTLAIEFHSGATWHYSPVPQEDADAVIGADSVGRAFNERIKGQYQGTQQ